MLRSFGKCSLSGIWLGITSSAGKIRLRFDSNFFLQTLLSLFLSFSLRTDTLIQKINTRKSRKKKIMFFARRLATFEGNHKNSSYLFTMDMINFFLLCIFMIVNSKYAILQCKYKWLKCFKFSIMRIER